MRFVDEVEITVSSGKGGDGMASFRREAKVPRGGPDGGDGGRGGAVRLTATRARNTLIDFRYRRVQHADNGQGGMKNKMYGASGADLILWVPVGTLVYDNDTDELLADLNADGAVYEIPGGKGGRGNPWFRTSTYQTPTEAEPGFPGVEANLRLELKLMADVGLLGFPNAGKSTLISRVSAAKPKIADYPFTTLQPHLGVVSVALGDSFVIADIPGLIEGAAEGKGLGLQFLRHVERCALYLHLVSAEAPDVADRVRILDNELAKYNETLLDREQVIVLTKCDLILDEERDALVEELKTTFKRRVFAVSSATNAGLQELILAVWREVRETKIPDEPSSPGGPTLD